MTTGTLGGLLRHLRQASLLQDSLTDGRLLEDFISRRDDAAFTALLRRHGPMVWGVCRRTLTNDADAEDAFQATFLVLVRKAASLARRAAVANWLYGVARRTALKAKAMNLSRRAKERAAGAIPRPAAEEEIWQELLPRLDDELSRLPDRYRTAIVLCDLEGMTVRDAAGRLRCPQGTVASRLARGRALLARRLARRGPALSGAVLAAAFTRGAASAGMPPPRVVAFTTRAAKLAAAGQTAGALSAGVAALTEGVLKTMLLTKLRLTTVIVLALAVLGTGAGLFLGYGQAGEKATGPQPPVRQTQAAQAAQKPTPAAGAKALEQALEAAGTVKDLEQKARALLAVAEVQIQAGERKAALRTLGEAAEAARAIPEGDLNIVRTKRNVLAQVAGAQAEAGDLEAARKTSKEGHRDYAYLLIAVAHARAGKSREALHTIGLIDAKVGYMKGNGLMEITAALAEAKDWDGARAALKAVASDTDRVRALAELAKGQARAGQKDEARKTLDEARRFIDGFLNDRQGKEDRAHCLSHLARAEAEVIDLKTALLTAESIPDILEKTVDGEVISFPFREKTLAELSARARDFKAARKAADAIDGMFHQGYQKGYCLRVIARSQAEAKDVKGALETADAIEHEFNKAIAYAEIAQAQARARDRDGAVETFAKALRLAEAVPDTANNFDRGRTYALRGLAAAQARVGEEKAAREWITRQTEPHLRAWALVGLAEGLAARQAAKKPQ
jgi:RNA polymerase sigma factor (sigma-70 family)